MKCLLRPNSAFANASANAGLIITLTELDVIYRLYPHEYSLR